MRKGATPKAPIRAPLCLPLVKISAAKIAFWGGSTLCPFLTLFECVFLKAGRDARMIFLRSAFIWWYETRVRKKGQWGCAQSSLFRKSLKISLLSDSNDKTFRRYFTPLKTSFSSLLGLPLSESCSHHTSPAVAQLSAKTEVFEIFTVRSCSSIQYQAGQADLSKKWSNILV